MSQVERIVGTGEMAGLVRGFDWAATALGPIAGWSREWVAVVNLVLSSPMPSRALWGPEFLLLYNDAYREIVGGRHPLALGRRSEAVYGEAWGVVGAQIEEAFRTGTTRFYERVAVPLEREGQIRERFLSYSYVPVYEEGQIAGLYGPVQDFTPAVEAERELQASEARASRVLQSIGDAVIVTNVAKRVTTMNPVAERLTGWSAEEAQGRLLCDVFRIVKEETREQVENPADKVERLGTVVGMANHTVLIARDGMENNIEDSGAPVRNDRGELTGVVLVFRSVNVRRAAEQERDGLTRRLDQVLEATSDAVMSVGRDWRVSYMNAAARRLTAPISETLDIVGRDLWESFPESVFEGSPHTYHTQRAMNEGKAGEFEAFYPEPLNLLVQVHVWPTLDGIAIFFRDMTGTRRAEQRLAAAETAVQTSEEELYWMVKLSGQIPWTAGPLGDETKLNEQWLEMSGLSAEQVNEAGWEQAQHSEDLDRMKAAWVEAVRLGKPYEVEHRVWSILGGSAGEWRWMRSRAYPRLGADGEVVKWYGITEDIEERKRGEMALVQSERLAAVGRLASSIAHEINNPLEAVTNLLYLARAGEEKEEVRQYLEMAERELARVSVIASQTLRFHRQSTSPVEVSGKDLMESVMSIYQRRLVSARVEVVERMRATQAVRCFEGEVRQVLSNLVGNAIDAMQPRGGRLYVRSQAGTEGATGRRGMFLTVADTGSGMDRATVQRIFEAFFTTKQIGGTGLGLWISRQIVERHSGVLRVRSSRGAAGSSGTVFRLFLPYEAVTR